MRKSGIPCYLTGGTALSRGYFNHRYSDDLDLFFNQALEYATHVQTLLAHLEAAQAAGEFVIDYRRLQRYETITQVFLRKTSQGEDLSLKLDVVNDVAVHYGYFVDDPVLGRLDGWRNILSNKLTAIFRFEPKDVVDIWMIAKHHQFQWMELIDEAKTKEAGVEPIVLFQILQTFPVKELGAIKWVTPVDENIFQRELHRIAEDILQGTANTLAE